jgi:polyhydroxyalkanoate synthesis regulator phasin
MLEEIRKNLVTGLGAVLLTKDKIEEVTLRLVEEARMSREDAERLADELYQAGQRRWTSMETSIKDAVRKSLSNMDIGSRRELDELKAKVDNLQKRVDLLEDTREQPNRNDASSINSPHQPL